MAKTPATVPAAPDRVTQIGDRAERELLAELLADFLSGLNSGDVVHDNWNAESDDDMSQLADLRFRLLA